MLLIIHKSVCDIVAKFYCERKISEVKYAQVKFNKRVNNYLCHSKSKWAFDLLSTNQSQIDWGRIADNPSQHAEKLLKSYRYGISGFCLSRNPSDWACELLKCRPNYIVWSQLSRNPANWAYDMLTDKNVREFENTHICKSI